MCDSGYRRAICRIFAGAILFAQITLSAHACVYAVGSLAAGSVDESPRTRAALPFDKASIHRDGGCEMMNKSAEPMPALCTEHCRYGQQVDQTPAVAVPAPVFVYLYPAPVLAPSRIVARATTGETQYARSPPHAILHCCFRI